MTNDKRDTDSTGQLACTELVLVIPCFNEAVRLDTEQIKAFASSHPNMVILLVDDGSTDSTEQMLLALQDQSPERFRCLLLPHNCGKGEAVRRGVEAAFQLNPLFIGYWDADLSTPLREVDRSLQILREEPKLVAVFGSRVRRLGADIQRSPARHYLGRVFATLASFVLKLAVYDTQCGAKIFRSCAPVREAFARPFVSSWIFDVELLARLCAAGANSEHWQCPEGLHEMPLTSWRDVEGSKLRPWHMAAAFRDLLRIRRDLKVSARRGPLARERI